MNSKDRMKRFQKASLITELDCSVTREHKHSSLQTNVSRFPIIRLLCSKYCFKVLNEAFSQCTFLSEQLICWTIDSKLLSTEASCVFKPIRVVLKAQRLVHGRDMKSPDGDDITVIVSRHWQCEDYSVCSGELQPHCVHVHVQLHIIKM